MRTFGKLVLALGMMALLASPVLAQQRKGQGQGQGPGGGFGRGGFGGGAMLLSNKSVQEELKLTDDQVEQAQKVNREIREKYQDDFAKLRDLEGTERREKMQSLNQQISEDSQKALAGVLKPEQMRRYHQIQRQVRGVEAFTEPRVQERLKLTDSQKEKIKDIQEDAREEMRDIFTSGGGDREEATKKITALRKESLGKVNALLTDDQKETWKEMTGAPFEVKFEQRPNNQ